MSLKNLVTALSLWHLLPTVCGASSAEQSSFLSEIGRSTNQSLLWGPYRPNLYFGVKPRLPNSLLTGLMWVALEDFRQVQASR